MYIQFQLLVVSEETHKGGDKINEKRRENNLPPLDVYTIGLVEENTLAEAEEAKVSSSNRRMRLLGTLLRPPVVSIYYNINFKTDCDQSRETGL